MPTTGTTASTQLRRNVGALHRAALGLVAGSTEVGRARREVRGRPAFPGLDLGRRAVRFADHTLKRQVATAVRKPAKASGVLPSEAEVSVTKSVEVRLLSRCEPERVSPGARPPRGGAVAVVQEGGHA